MAKQRITLDPATPLRTLREALGLTQHQAAELLGVERSALSNAELRGSGVTVAKLVEYLRGYGRELRIAAVEGSEPNDDKAS